jgi:oligo-1,6-glucosidase
LSYYRELVRLRKSKPVLIFGSYQDVSGSHPHLYAYKRADASGQVIVVLNFSPEAAEYLPPVDTVLKRPILSNVAGVALENPVRLLPWQAIIFESAPR